MGGGEWEEWEGRWSYRGFRVGQEVKGWMRMHKGHMTLHDNIILHTPIYKSVSAVVCLSSFPICSQFRLFSQAECVNLATSILIFE